MDKSNLLNIIKTLTETMHCPTCGTTYTVGEVQYMSQNEGSCLLQVACRKCNLPVWINFLVDERPVVKKIRIKKEGDSIATDEVIEFHQMIKNFDGDFKKVCRNR